MESPSQAHFRSPAEDHDRYPFRKCPCDRVVGAEAPDSVCDADCTEARHPGISIGRIARVQLAAGVDQLDTALFYDVKELQDVVAGHSKDMTESHLFESG